MQETSDLYALRGPYFTLAAPLLESDLRLERLRTIMSTKYAEIYGIYQELRQSLVDLTDTYSAPDRPPPKSQTFEKFVYLWCEPHSNNLPLPAEEMNSIGKKLKTRFPKPLAKQYARHGVPKVTAELAQTLEDTKIPLFPITHFYSLNEILETAKKYPGFLERDKYSHVPFATDGNGNDYSISAFEGSNSVCLYNPEEERPIRIKSLRDFSEDYGDLEFELWLSQYAELRKPRPNMENFKKLREKLEKTKTLATAFEQHEHFGRYKVLFSDFSKNLNALMENYENASNAIKEQSQ